MTHATFSAALLDPDLPPPPGLTDPQGRPAPKRFAVYRNNVAVGLTAALRAGFPVLERLVGEEFFAAMAGAFLRAHPPRSRLMMLYGAQMPAFLASFPPVAHLPYLPDIARLELALRASYHAADSIGLPVATLAALTPDTFMASRLCLAPSLQLIGSAWPVYSIWSNTGGVPITWEPQDVVVLRPEYDPAPRLLPNGGGAFIAALQAGKSVAQAIDAAGDAHDLTATLSLLVSHGAIIQPKDTP